MDIASNELADRAARQAALEAANWSSEEDDSVKSVQEVKVSWQSGRDHGTSSRKEDSPKACSHMLPPN